MCDLTTKQEARIILQSLEQAMDVAGIASAKTDARCLLGLALGRDIPVLPHEVLPPLDTVCQKHLSTMLERRLAGEPISRIRGWREFWSLQFAISQSTLDPRPDSETIIEAAVTWVILNSTQTAPLRCLDLGTGSGCLLLALLSELPHANGVGIDLSLDAIGVAAANANSLGLGGRAHFHQHSFCDDLSKFGSFDIILSNPPYIPTLDIAGLAVDVRDFDPALALDGGIDGMGCWQGLLPRLSDSLSDNGAAFVEIGMGQEAAIVQLAGNTNLELVNSYRDLSDVIRCLQFGIKM
ncbi:peptide chain release factor N(5)-glutamine methyltransferase [Candidatus Puniceispirillum sp.]|nr:peptide chain release factor N(5)-glutamine methyltransferase [Candidatus Puniceispirillum sp.]